MHCPAKCNGYGNLATMLLYFAYGSLHGVARPADIVKQDDLLSRDLVLIHEEPGGVSLWIVMASGKVLCLVIAVSPEIAEAVLCTADAAYHR